MNASQYAERQTLKIAEAVASTGMSRSKLYRLIDAKALKTAKVGRTRLILRDSLDALLQPEAA